MFTGIIEETGTLEFFRRTSSFSRIRVGCQNVIEDTRTGDSICVNGICLTICAKARNWFEADVMGETVNRTDMSRLKRGALLNLERAMPAGGRFGGHVVTGHIDGTGVIRSIWKDRNATWFQIESDREIIRLTAQKGAIAVDGISLTIADIEDNAFSVSVIPHTLLQTNLQHKGVNSLVNLENDIFAKYIDRIINAERSASSLDAGKSPMSCKIDIAMLQQNGFC